MNTPMNLVALSEVKVRNFRSLRDVSVGLVDYTVLIGPNGSGKSSVLYALAWLFGKRELDAQDRSIGVDPTSEISVEVALTGNETRRVRRSWVDAKTERWEVWQPTSSECAAVRSEVGVAAKRTAYAALAEKSGFESLHAPDPKANADTIEVWLNEWERAQDCLPLEPRTVGADEAKRILASIEFVLVPAATDIESQVGRSGKAGVLETLTTRFVTPTVEAVRADWARRYAGPLKVLAHDVEAALAQSGANQEKAINAQLERLLPETTLKVAPRSVKGESQWTDAKPPLMDVRVKTSGLEVPVGKHGHGVQRAVLISMLQAAAEASSGGSTEAVESSNPALLLAFEEPEIYQHPLRAREFASALQALADRDGYQVVAATHSPLFARSDHFEKLRRFTLGAEGTVVHASSVETVSQLLPVVKDAADIQRRLERLALGEFVEAFFAEGVVLVEGATDRLVIEHLAEITRHNLARSGVVVVDLNGKESLALAESILSSLGLCTYVVFDGDACTHRQVQQKRDESDEDFQARKEERRASHKSQTQKLLDHVNPRAKFVQLGALPAVWEASTLVADSFTMFQNDLEDELEQWPSHVQARRDLGIGPREKKIHLVRDAVRASTAEDAPQALRIVVEAIFARVEGAAESATAEV